MSHHSHTCAYAYTNIFIIIPSIVTDYELLLVSPHLIPSLPPSLFLSLINSQSGKAVYSATPLTATELISVHMSHHDLKRLELYARNMVDHHMIGDILPTLARLLFLGRLRGMRLSYLQVAILLATGLQHRDVDAIALELDLPVNQVLAFFNKVRTDNILYIHLFP